MKAEYKNLEFEHQSLLDRVEKSKDTLKILTSNKEYQVLLREIDDNKKRVSKIEDEMLAMMEILEVEDKKIQELQE